MSKECATIPADAPTFARHRIPYRRPGDPSTRRAQRIPYTIFQTFKAQDVPVAMRDAIESWVAQNPEYDHEYFDDERVAEYVAAFPCEGFSFSREQLLKAHRKIRPGAGKADLFRYLIMYDRGGVYMDVDTTCLAPISSYLDPDDEVLSGLGARGDFHQWGLIYARRHPFMRQAIERIVANILHERFIPGFRPLEAIGGPPCLDRAIKYVLGLPTSHRFTPGTGVFTTDGRANRYRLLPGDFFGHRVNFRYPEYLLDLERMRTPHWTRDSLFNDVAD